jgi:hypothetical protein
VANPADKEFTARDNADPVDERLHFTAVKARSALWHARWRDDRAMLKSLIYSGMRIDRGVSFRRAVRNPATRRLPLPVATMICSRLRGTSAANSSMYGVLAGP